MNGSVSAGRALLPVPLRLADGRQLTIEFGVDTGFTDFLTLPVAAIAAMGLPFLTRVAADLADDSSVELAVHAVTILWNGAERDIRVVATGRRPLLGTALLDGHELVAQFTEGGLVTVEDLLIP